VTGRPLLTARELAEQLGISTGALLRWTRRGEVPAVKLPSGAVRYRPDAIDAWLAEHEMGAAGREVSPTHPTAPAFQPTTSRYVGPRHPAGPSGPASPRSEEDLDGRT
jgi:excisionase family DNA binding protein